MLKKLFMYEKLIKEKGIGLVEALVSLAIVSTGMVVITSLSIKSLRMARYTEMEDVAVQIGAEAMDFMKQSGDIDADTLPPINGNSIAYKLNTTNGRLERKAGPGSSVGHISDCTANPGLDYEVAYIQDFNVCQQIIVKFNTTSNQYEITVVVVFDSITGKQEVREFYGNRTMGGFI